MIEKIIVLNDQGGEQISVTIDKTNTLRAEDHGHPPIIIDKRFINLEYHPGDSRIRIVDADISQTLGAKMGTGGNNVPLVLVLDDDDIQKATESEIKRRF